MALSKQAENSINLYKGNPAGTILQGLRLQPKQAAEMREHFGCQTNEQLAQTLALL